MNNSKPNFYLNNNDIAVLSASLKLLTSNPIDGISKSKQLETIVLADSVKHKIENIKSSPKFNAEDFRIMYAALLNLKIIADEANSFPTDIDFKKDSKKYYLIISKLINMIEFALETLGVHDY